MKDKERENTPEAESPWFKELPEKLLRPALNSTDVSALGQAIVSLRAAAEAQKLEREATKLRVETENLSRTARADARRFQLTVLAPLITAIAVAAGLAVQVYQVDRNTTLQRDLNESTQFKDAITLASSKDPLQSIAGAILVQKFTLRPNYKDEARGIAIGMLSRGVPTESFDLFFPTVERSTAWSNYRDTVVLSQRLYERYHNETDVIEHLTKTKAAANPKSGTDGESKIHEAVRDQISRQEKIVSGLLAEKLRTRPKELTLDFTGAELWQTDLSKASFDGVILKDATVGLCEVEDADFGKAGDADGSLWPGTPWWQAKKISAKLLTHLLKEYPFEKDAKYAGKPTDLNEFCSAVDRFGREHKLCGR